jgi:hypothetical protein
VPRLPPRAARPDAARLRGPARGPHHRLHRHAQHLRQRTPRLARGAQQWRDGSSSSSSSTSSHGGRSEAAPRAWRRNRQRQRQQQQRGRRPPPAPPRAAAAAAPSQDAHVPLRRHGEGLRRLGRVHHLPGGVRGRPGHGPARVSVPLPPGLHRRLVRRPPGSVSCAPA